MKFFGISNHGLTAIALLVVVLWSVIIVERGLTRRAQEDYDELKRSWGYVPAETAPTGNDELRVG